MSDGQLITNGCNTVPGLDRDGQGIHAGALHEARGLRRVRHLARRGNAGFRKQAHFRFDRGSQGVSGLDNLARQGYVVLERQVRGIHHDGVAARAQRPQHLREGARLIEEHRRRQGGTLRQTPRQRGQLLQAVLLQPGLVHHGRPEPHDER